MNEIEKAIEHFREAIRKNTDYPECAAYWLQRKHNYALALTALREMQEREKGCEYCTSENPPTLFENGETIIYYHSGHRKFLDGTYELNWIACPMCGRRLEGGQDE